MRLLSGGRALIRRHRRVALNQPHAVEWHAQLFGDQLHLCGVETLSELALAGVGGDGAVGRDGDPRIELWTAGAVKALSEDATHVVDHARGRKRDDDRAGTFEERTA